MTPAVLTSPTWTSPVPVDRLGYDELAERFDVNENAAVQLVHRARRNLVALVA